MAKSITKYFYDNAFIQNMLQKHEKVVKAIEWGRGDSDPREKTAPWALHY
jgi:hypothetical protein